MTLVAHVDGGAFGVARRLPRRDEGVDARGRAAAGEEPACALRIAEPSPEPVDDDQFHVARTARNQPGTLVDVVAGGHEVSKYAGPCGRGRDESKTSWVIQACRIRENIARGPLHDLRRRPAIFGWVLRQLTLEDLPELALPGIFSGQALDSFNHELERLLAQGRASARATFGDRRLRGRPTVPSALPCRGRGVFASASNRSIRHTPLLIVQLTSVVSIMPQMVRRTPGRLGRARCRIPTDW